MHIMHRRDPDRNMTRLCVVALQADSLSGCSATNWVEIALPRQECSRVVSGCLT
jgi:hypothetical protein